MDIYPSQQGTWTKTNRSTIMTTADFLALYATAVYITAATALHFI
jgi:hypothetical protein